MIQAMLLVSHRRASSGLPGPARSGHGRARESLTACRRTPATSRRHGSPSWLFDSRQRRRRHIAEPGLKVTECKQHQVVSMVLADLVENDDG